MTKNRFFLDAPFTQGQIVELTEEELHHLKVMRCLQGETITLVNGRNQLATGLIQSLDKQKDKQKAVVALQHVISKEPVKKQCILVQALLKPKNLDLVIEKGTELGATAFFLFPGEFSEKKELSPHQLLRYRHITISALKQCGRLDLPKIELYPSLSKGSFFPLKDFPPKGLSGALFYADLEAKNYFTPPSCDMALIVGPEKGFSKKEKEILLQQSQGVRIHPNTLRAETASLCFLSLASSNLSY